MLQEALEEGHPLSHVIIACVVVAIIVSGFWGAWVYYLAKWKKKDRQKKEVHVEMDFTPEAENFITRLLTSRNGKNNGDKQE